MKQTSAWAIEESLSPKYVDASCSSDWKYQYVFIVPCIFLYFITFHKCNLTFIHLVIQLVFPTTYLSSLKANSLYLDPHFIPSI